MNVQLPGETLAEIKEALFRGQKIQAIKLYRESTGTGLAEAKSAIEDLESELRKNSPEKFSTIPSGKGCLGAAGLFCLLLVAVAFWLTRSSWL